MQRKFVIVLVIVLLVGFAVVFWCWWWAAGLLERPSPHSRLLVATLWLTKEKESGVNELRSQRSYYQALNATALDQNPPPSAFYTKYCITHTLAGAQGFFFCEPSLLWGVRAQRLCHARRRQRRSEHRADAAESPLVCAAMFASVREPSVFLSVYRPERQQHAHVEHKQTLPIPQRSLLGRHGQLVCWC